MARIELGLSVMGFMSIRRISGIDLRLLIDLASRSAGSLKISTPSNGESKDRAVDLYVLQR